MYRESLLHLISITAKNCYVTLRGLHFALVLIILLQKSGQIGVIAQVLTLDLFKLLHSSKF